MCYSIFSIFTLFFLLRFTPASFVLCSTFLIGFALPDRRVPCLRSSANRASLCGSLSRCENQEAAAKDITEAWVRVGLVAKMCVVVGAKTRSPRHTTRASRRTLHLSSVAANPRSFRTAASKRHPEVAVKQHPRYPGNIARCVARQSRSLRPRWQGFCLSRRLLEHGGTETSVDSLRA